MSEERFKPGDLLQLKSGGPVMTVAVCDGDVITCTWFASASEVGEIDFLEVMLEPVK